MAAERRAELREEMERAEEARVETGERRLEAEIAASSARETQSQQPVREPQPQQEEQAANETKEESVEQMTSFSGVSNQRLEQMYRDGQISRYDYDREVEAREARQEEMRAEDENLNRETEIRENELRRVENMASAVKNAVSDEASETLTAEQRLDVVDKLQSDTNEKVRREEDQGRLWDYQLLT